MLRFSDLTLHRREIPLRLGGGDRKSHQHLLLAFLFAGGLHLAMLSIFRISAVNNVPPAPLYPTTFVEIDAPFIAGSEIANLAVPELESPLQGIQEGMATKTRSLTAPKPTQHMPLLTAKTLYRSSRTISRGFDPIEAHHFKPISPNFQLLERTDPITFRVSGPLTLQELLEDGTSVWNERLKGQQIGLESRLLFDVRVEGRTGKIVWFDELEETIKSDPVLQQIAESVLSKVRFKRDSERFMLEGYIEIVFRLESIELAEREHDAVYRS